MTLEQILAACAALAATTGLVGSVAGRAQFPDHAIIDELTRQAAEANASLMRGDIDTYRKTIRLADDFTLMDPFGGKPTGKPRLDKDWRRIGRFFKDGRDATFELITAYQSPGLVVLVANERAHVAVGSRPAQHWALRVTLVFRRLNDDWHLVHRHADPLVEGITLPQAAKLTLGTWSSD